MRLADGNHAREAVVGRVGAAVGGGELDARVHGTSAIVEDAAAQPSRRDGRAPAGDVDAPPRRQRAAADRRDEERHRSGAIGDERDVRPVGGESSRDIFLIWTFESEPHPFVWPPSFDPHLGEVLLRGLARMIPAAQAYRGEGSRGRVDGGYYTKTPENRPLVGPLPVDGAFVIGALSGYGIMASQAAAELLAAHVTGAALPAYAAALSPARYDDPAYRRRLESWDAKAGQL